MGRATGMGGSRATVAVAASALGVVALGAGCANLTQAEIKFLETRELDLPYEEAYTAALNGLFSLGLVIQHSDKGSGVITGQSGDHVQLANARYRKSRYAVKKVSLLITPRGPRRSQLRMKVLVNEKPKLDRTLMTQIWQRIEREAMLETQPIGAGAG